MTRQEWAANLIQRGGTMVPPYGSPEWVSLPEGHPAKIAAVVVAAESWARDGDDLERRLRVEVLALSKSDKQLEDAEYEARMYLSRVLRLPDPKELEAEFWEWVRGDVA